MNKHELEGPKQMIYFFKEYVIEVKQVTKTVVGPQATAATTS